MIGSMSDVNGRIGTMVPDDLTLALEAAKARIADVYAAGCLTLVDRFSQEEWETRDGSAELCLVEDPSCFDDERSLAA